MPAYRIEFEPIGKRGQCPDDKSLLNCARAAGVGISSVCGGKGTCGACKIRVMHGSVSSPTPAEQAVFSSLKLSEGWRLACQVYPLSDCTIHLPPESMTVSQRTQIEGVDSGIEIAPAVKQFELDSSPPSLHDLIADGDRVIQSLARRYNVHCDIIDIDAVRELPTQLREWNWKCTAVVQGSELISVQQSSGLFGLAVDVGTTKIAGYLVDLQNGRTVAAKGIMNPQIGYGEDIITRIEFAMKSPSDAHRLRDEVIAALNELANALCAIAKSDVRMISNVVIVGNTAMHHLLLGLPVAYLVKPPFVPAVAHALNVKCRDVGLQFASGAYAHFLPNIAGYVGADHVAFLLTVINGRTDDIPTLALDIGTNTEVSLIYKDEIYSVSCPSGPTFEGGHLSHGMRAADGAIERVRLERDHVIYQTIGNVAPMGICGTAAIDALAQFYSAGLIKDSGRIEEHHPLIRQNSTGRELVIVEEQEREGRDAITLTQKDVRELQVAKGSISAGIQVLAAVAGMPHGEPVRVIIAGAFGTYIDISSAITIGLLPSMPPENFIQVGNAAGTGARHVLLSLKERHRAEEIAARVKYIELAIDPNFKDLFMKASYLGSYQL